ncbi:zinc-ribbon domain-containing protein [Candidatus Woesearchaeota archaeon]|nr:zinc-ribbon domain-containing protein [Candidatus Woesearchaeota archaeon]
MLLCKAFLCHPHSCSCCRDNALFSLHGIEDTAKGDDGNVVCLDCYDKWEEENKGSGKKSASSKANACAKCGKKIDDESTFCKHCGAKVKFSMRVCECGAKLDKDDDFCPECGRKA